MLGSNCNFGSDCDFLYSCGIYDRTVIKWDLRSGNQSVTFTGTTTVNSLNFYGGHLITGNSDGTIFAWNSTSGYMIFYI